MGYYIESYTLGELDRISGPGEVPASLFWALPVGAWQPSDLVEVWHWFTEHPSVGRNLGVLLVKEPGRRQGEKDTLNLASVGAKLSDVMPAGAERFVRSSAYRSDWRRVLLLSGGYPQPGWGVLVEWPSGGCTQFAKLIETTIAQLRQGSGGDQIETFSLAAESFHRWRTLRNAPAKPSLSTIENEILAAESIDDFLREAIGASQIHEYRQVAEKLTAAIDALGKAKWLEVPASSLQQVLDKQRNVQMAAAILEVSPADFSTHIEPKLPLLLAAPQNREAEFLTLPSRKMKDTLRACLHLRSSAIVPETETFHAWGEQVLSEVPTACLNDLITLRTAVGKKLAGRRGEKAQIDHEHQVALEQWRSRSSESREIYHHTAEKAVEAQWSLGPRFLVEFEHVCRGVGLWARSIPWDPARMIGWKIMASEVRLDSRDLQVAAQELAPGTTVAPLAGGSTPILADGSYFTDYVHHIAMSKPGSSPRSVTRDLLARLLRPGEMMNLIATHGGESPKTAGALDLAEEVVDAFGWRQSEEFHETPLAATIKIGANSELSLTESLGGNDLRIVVESFCKDIVDVVVAHLRYSHAELWTAIEERTPNYRASSRSKDWDEEVRLMTAGGAAIILPALAPLAFPARADAINDFVSNLRELSEILNICSHHHEGDRHSSSPLSGAPQLIHTLLAKAEEFLGELPWHLQTSFVYGDQPKVLSGEGWSHGSPAPRLLKVIVWTGKTAGPRITLWNKTRRNPIMTDPVFIVRPRQRRF